MLSLDSTPSTSPIVPLAQKRGPLLSEDCTSWVARVPLSSLSSLKSRSKSGYTKRLLGQLPIESRLDQPPVYSLQNAFNACKAVYIQHIPYTDSISPRTAAYYILL